MSVAQPASAVSLVDPRSPRFGAAITSVVLIATLLLGPTWGSPLLVLQTLAFAAGSLLGLPFQPYGWVFRTWVRPRLGPPAELEDARPPRFAQTVGLVFALAGLAGAILTLPVLFYVAVGFALVAALLNAVFDFCLGCELYLLVARLRGTAPAPAQEGRAAS
ncbi:DUF4395 domain-containing protein [Propionicicella superfundia]|uniref:DUF4395 domain-containing protein n=1 Tax=Propionicicella superfundia TaxID=348582 RepID=UPI000687B217|nr:DUF4395 domain-containing protein [Propionicicella superfundia]